MDTPSTRLELEAFGFRVMRGTRDLKPFLLECNYADFSDPSRYQEALERLLKALERKGHGSTSSP